MSPPDVTTAGSTRETVAASIRRALVLGVGVWQVAVVLAVLVVETRVPAAPLVLAHLGVVGLVALTLYRPRWFAPTITVCYVLWFVDYRASADLDDALTLAACWFGNLLYGVSALAMRGWARVVVPVGGAIVVAVALDLTDPLWDIEVTSAYVVTAIAICAAGVFALPALWRIADEVDDSAVTLEQQRAEAIVAERTGQEAAEDARIVHDTVINTLGAVAGGGRGTAVPDVVAARCERDLRVVRTLLDGRRAELGGGLGAIAADVDGIDVRRDGPSPGELCEIEAALGSRTVGAVSAAAREAVLNAAKHAGVAEVWVHVERTDGTVVVTVRDAGSGTAEDVGDDAAGLGLRESVHARMTAVGGRAEIVLEAGSGTTVRLECPLAPHAEENPLPTADPTDADPTESGRSPGAIADALLRRAAWLWTGGVVLVGIVIEAVNRPGELTATYGMLLVVVAGAGATWWSLRRTGRLLRPVEGFLVVGTSVGFLLAMAGIGFATVGVMYVQAIGITPLTTLLLVVGSRIAHRLALGGLVATAAVLATVLATDDLGRAAVVVIGVAPAVGVALGWAAFCRLVRRLVVESEHNRVLAFAERVQTRTRREVEQARRLWSTAGLEHAAELLARIVEEPTVLADPSVRTACADEERHLRQLLLLSAATPRMSPWFAQALQRARERGVSLSVRSGDEDVPDTATAQDLGRLTALAVEAVGHGAAVTIGFYPVGDGQQLVLVVPAGCSADVVAAARSIDHVRCRVTSLSEVDVVEVSAQRRKPVRTAPA